MTPAAASEYGSTLVRPGYFAYCSESLVMAAGMRRAAGRSDRSESTPRSMYRASSRLQLKQPTSAGSSRTNWGAMITVLSWTTRIPGRRISNRRSSLSK
jgi:hypothetical protein